MKNELYEVCLMCYQMIFKSFSGTSASMYSDGIHDIDHSSCCSMLNDTNIDDSSNDWTGSEMEEFDLEESDLIDELKINDILHVTTPHDNASIEVQSFHGTEAYDRFSRYLY